MADIRRRSVADYPRINNCAVHPECFAHLNAIAGRHGMGHAIELMCKRERLVLAILESNLPAEARAKAAKALMEPELETRSESVPHPS